MTQRPALVSFNGPRQGFLGSKKEWKKRAKEKRRLSNPCITLRSMPLLGLLAPQFRETGWIGRSLSNPDNFWMSGQSKLKTFALHSIRGWLELQLLHEDQAFVPVPNKRLVPWLGPKMTQTCPSESNRKTTIVKLFTIHNVLPFWFYLPEVNK